MLDNASFEYSNWNQWKQSEWKLLEFKYFLWNQRVVSTDTKPFLITEWTKLQVEEVILWERIDVLVSGIKYKVLRIIIDAPKKTVDYKNDTGQLKYETAWTTQENFMRSWFTESLKDSY